MDLEITTSLPPNILDHIYASVGLYGMRQYQKSFHHTLRESDHTFLESLLPYFGGKPPMGGPLFLYLYQIPSYFPAENICELQRNFDMIIDGLESEWIFYRELDEDTVKALEVWIPPRFFQYPSQKDAGRILSQMKDMLSLLKDVVTTCHQAFYEEHWRTLKPLLQKEAEKIHKEIDHLPVFEAWSEALGLTFPYIEYLFYLCEARRGSTSILAEKFALPLNIPLERAVDTIIHEVGIHFIIRPGEYLERGLAVETFMQNQEKIGRMEEAATCYFKPQVYESLGLEQREDYHLKLMKIGPEIQRFRDVWENDEPSDPIEGLLSACDLL